jgi:hypothetical protein
VTKLETESFAHASVYCEVMHGNISDLLASVPQWLEFDGDSLTSVNIQDVPLTYE